MGPWVFQNDLPRWSERQDSNVAHGHRAEAKGPGARDLRGGLPPSLDIGNGSSTVGKDSLVVGLLGVAGIFSGMTINS